MVRNIKLLLVGFGGLVLLLLLMGLAIPSKVKISRGVLLSEDYETVYASLQNVGEWEAWMPWVKYDSTATVSRSENSNGGVAVFRWSGNANKNAGSIYIVQTRPEEISLLFQFQNNIPAKGGFRIHKVEESEGVELIWFMEYRLRWYPWERFYGIFADKIWGQAFEKGLADFQAHLSAQAAQAFVTREN